MAKPAETVSAKTLNSLSVGILDALSRRGLLNEFLAGMTPEDRATLDAGLTRICNT